MGDVIGYLLPTAAAVALSPIPIVAVVGVLGTARARVNGVMFLIGWVVGLAAITAVVLLLTGDAGDPGSELDEGIEWVRLAAGALLLVLAGRKWATRPPGDGPEEPPGWMASLDEAPPIRVLLIGLALAAANPKNLALTTVSAASIAQAGLSGRDAALAGALFVALGSLTVFGSVVFTLLAGARADAPLASVKGFMAVHSVAIMVVILVIFGLKLIGEALPDVL